MFRLIFVTPEKRLVLDKDLEQVSLPGHKGTLNILPGHAPLTTSLRPGKLEYRLSNGEEKSFAISWGYCQVSGDGVSVMAESALLPEEIESDANLKQLGEIEKKIMGQFLSDDEFQQSLRLRDQLQSELDFKSAKV